MAHNHSHHHALTVSRKLGIATAANLLVVAAELGVGAYSGSLALVGDALHNLTDSVALLLALIAVRLQQRPATAVKTFGYQRAGVLAAFVNAAMLLAFTIFVFREAIERLRAPSDVATIPMLVMATVALVINALTAFSLHREGRHDVNVRGAVVHMISDAVSSAGIIVAAILIRVTGSMQWDAIVSMVIGALIVWSSWGVLRESVNLLLEGTPEGIDPDGVIRALASIEGILGVHHLHIWALGPSSPALSCHLMVGDVPIRTTARILEEVNALLSREYRIAHTTIQFELAECAVDDPSCVRLNGPGIRADTIRDK